MRTSRWTKGTLYCLRSNGALSPKLLRSLPDAFPNWKSCYGSLPSLNEDDQHAANSKFLSRIGMNYDTVVTDLFNRFPRLQTVLETRFDFMGDEPSIQYIVFGSVLIPALEEALSAGNLGLILPICAFLEDVADSSKEDSGLENLLRVEVGEWLGGAANESILSPWLGKETKRICGYVPGLATQRRALQEEQKRRGLRICLKTSRGTIEGICMGRNVS